MAHIILKIIFTFLFTVTYINAQISPGELTSAHKDLEGLSNCTKCHELGEKVLNSKCLNCHSEIRSLIILGQGFHSSSEVAGQECVKCHAEHFGRNFRIVNFDPDGFDHSNTGYELTDAHIKVKCKDCHQTKNIADPTIAKRKATYLGLNSNCFSCHDDYHQTTLGDNCISCHNTEKFRPAIKFNHDKAKFVLTGKHKTVKCIKCHPVNKVDGKEFQKFTGLPFTNCYPCHQDNHNGKFGRNCESCHVTSNFTDINKSQFDHSKTNYPLIGKHKFVSCNKCHETGLSQNPEYKKCINCHSDYHNLQFVVNDNVKDCSGCHIVNGFRPSIITAQKHNDFKFNLDGAHLAVPCRSCHFIEEKWKFIDLGLRCINCHENIHGSEVVEKYFSNSDCGKCHQTLSWSTINFDHNSTEFKLKGKHDKQSCRSCHEYSEKSEDRKLIFKSLNTNCEVCHTDVHAGQFAEGEFSDCVRCHTFNNWKPDRFDHELTRFSLKGAHKNLNCFSCHPVSEVNGIKFIKYKLENFKCTDCHT
ncbi:cytochrome C [Bacteroidota bacterium]